jgi:hypothetical protein
VVGPQVIRTGFKTKSYRNPKGDDGVSIIIALEEDGEFIKVMAPRCYHYPAGDHKEALFQTLLMISWMTKMIQFEYDKDDGEIRAIIEFPLEDAILTDKQLLRCLHALAQMVDEHDHLIRGAMEHGQLPESKSELDAAFAEFMKQRRAAQGNASSGLDLEG